jgi:hypothetical protein
MTPSCVDLAAASGYWTAVIKMLRAGALDGLKANPLSGRATGDLKVTPFTIHGSQKEEDTTKPRLEDLEEHDPYPNPYPHHNLGSSPLPDRSAGFQCHLLLHCAALDQREDVFGE